MRTEDTPRCRVARLLLAVLTLVSSLALVAPAFGADRLLIAQPGYPGSTKEAAKFIAELTEFLRASGLPKLEGGVYHNDAKAAIAAARADSPRVGIVSLGFYLANRDALGLDAVLWSEPAEAFYLCVAKGSFSKLSELAGKSVTGTPFVDPPFVNRIILRREDGRPIDAAVTSWKASAAKYFSRGIRNVTRGRADALLLSELEYRGLARLRAAEKIELLVKTRALPTAVVVAMGGKADAALRTALQRSFTSLSKADDARELRSTMGIRGFKPVDARRLTALEKAYAVAGAAR